MRTFNSEEISFPVSSKYLQMVVVCAILRSNSANSDYIILIEKQNPPWQRYKLNLPGGKLKEGESSFNGGIRELREETGLSLNYITYCGSMGTRMRFDRCKVTEEVLLKDLKTPGVVHVLAGVVKPPPPDYENIYDFMLKNRRESEKEQLYCLSINKALNDSRLIDSLRFLIPHCIASMDGFVMHNQFLQPILKPPKTHF